VSYDGPVYTDGRGEEAGTFELFHPRCYVTDDTVLTVAIMDWLLHPQDVRAVLKRYFRQSDRPELFGRVFREWASRDTDEPCGSFGNGAAMRVAPVAFAAESVDEVLRLARESALATHATADAIAGAEAVALGVFLARTGCSQEEIQERIRSQFGYDLNRSLDEIRPGYKFTSACPETVPIAFRAFLESANYEETLRRAISMGGDTDTNACMAGAIAGAHWGMRTAIADQIIQRLPPALREVVLAFEERLPQVIRLTD
jgi:ADP-ribosylglycohydrolase